RLRTVPGLLLRAAATAANPPADRVLRRDPAAAHTARAGLRARRARRRTAAPPRPRDAAAAPRALGRRRDPAHGRLDPGRDPARGHAPDQPLGPVAALFLRQPAPGPAGSPGPAGRHARTDDGARRRRLASR